MGISGLVVKYIVAIDVTRVRFLADALLCAYNLFHRLFTCVRTIGSRVSTVHYQQSGAVVSVLGSQTKGPWIETTPRYSYLGEHAVISQNGHAGD